jgi:hypothetical protein
MTSKFKVLLVCVGAVVALSAVGAGSAQALRPTQPQWTVNGATLKSAITVEFSSLTTRIWVIGLSAVIVCLHDEGIVLLEPGGLDKIDRFIHTGCSLHLIHRNAQGKLEEETETAACTISSAGAPTGEIILTAGIKTHLVWSTGVTPLVLDLTEPAGGSSGTFVTIEVGNATGKTCLEKANLEVKGSYLTWLPRFSPANAYEEWIMGDELLETLNEKETVRQRFTKYEFNTSGALTAEPTITRGETKEPIAFESTEQVERPVENKLRGTFGVTE